MAKAHSIEIKGSKHIMCVFHIHVHFRIKAFFYDDAGIMKARSNEMVR